MSNSAEQVTELKLNSPPPLTRKPSFLRARWMVDEKAQYTYLVYVILLGCLFTAFNIVTSVLWHIMIGSAELVGEIPTSRLVFTIAAIACLGIIVIVTAVFGANFVSNRLAGPVWRMNENMKKLLATGTIEKLRFREKDQFHELAENYNRLLVQYENLKSQIQTLRESPPTKPAAE
jgi:methyl-accepting chemotaxis protein